jgi:hypothetical protein
MVGCRRLDGQIGGTMIDARFVTIIDWPGKKLESWKRRDGRFKAAYAKTLDVLERELAHLRAKDIVIQAYFDRSSIRNDGWPKSSARPSEPGVVVSFIGKAGEMAFPCDTYTDWEDNLRAIALSLEALRTVDRYGVTQHGEQYKGWAKLPPAPEKMSVQDALAFIALQTGIHVTSAEGLRDAYRMAAKNVHPDSSNGSNDQFVLLGKAKAALEEAYGWR